MKARIGAILALLVTLASLHVPSAQAKVEPVAVANSFFAALNAGDHDAAVATFTADAVATLARGETYRDAAGIEDMVQLMEHAGREHKIVQATAAGDTVIMSVEVSDHGIRWGEQTIVARVQGGKLHTFEETAFRLRLDS